MCTRKDITAFLRTVPKLSYIGRGVTDFWETKDMYEFLKPVGQKGLGWIKIYQYNNQNDITAQYGQELKITVKLTSYLEEDTFFEGFIETIDDLKIIFKSIGIRYEN